MQMTYKWRSTEKSVSNQVLIILDLNEKLSHTIYSKTIWISLCLVKDKIEPQVRW